MKKIRLLAVGMWIIAMQACGHDFLEVKPDAAIGTPSKVSDYQAILDNSTSVMNSNSVVELGMIGAEEFYIEDVRWHTYPSKQQKNAYIWADAIYDGEAGRDWNEGYEKILYANMVLDGLARIRPTGGEQDAWNNARGSALFYRALSFYRLAQLFAKPYNKSTADSDMGIPLRLDADVTIRSARATISETYGRIVTDLVEAIELLPNLPLIKMRPSKASCFALLARVYLQMEIYEEAERFANEALKLQGKLIDYNELSVTANYPFETGYGATNDEVIYFCYIPAFPIFGRSQMHVNDDLLKLYDVNDRRISIFYTEGSDNNIFFKGSYFGSLALFVGFSVSEMILIRAECRARLADAESAIEDINWLSSHRYETGTFIPYTDLLPEEVLILVLQERRRELAFRGVRWEDMRRLNKDSRFAHSLTRKVDGTAYTLEPMSDKYVWPIPPDVIGLTGMPQNPR